MLDLFAGAFESAKASKEIAKSLLTLRDEEMIRSRVFELTSNLMDLQQQLMEAQLKQMELIHQVHELESEKRRLAEAKDLTQRYVLHTFVTGNRAYVLKTESQETPDQYFCTRCLESDNKIITLQGRRVLKCPDCETEIKSAPAETSRYVTTRSNRF